MFGRARGNHIGASACVAALALIVTAATPAPAEQSAPQVKTYRIRISITTGEAEPAGGSPLHLDDQVVGTISFAPSGDFKGEHYLGSRLTRRLHARYRGMKGEDPGEPCVWLLDTEGPAHVELRAIDAEGWQLSIETPRKPASLHTDAGSCPASEIMPGLPFFATVTGLEGPVPFDPGHVYRSFDNGPGYSLTLAVLDACEGDDFRDGPKDPRSEGVRSAVAGGLKANGAATGPEVVGITQSSVLEFNVRLGPGHVPLPTRACLQQRIDAGEIQEGALTGAEHLLVGAVQESGGTTRVTVRTVNAATGEVAATGKGDASGPDALGEAMHAAFAQLGWSFGG